MASPPDRRGGGGGTNVPFGATLQPQQQRRLSGDSVSSVRSGVSQGTVSTGVFSMETASTGSAGSTKSTEMSDFKKTAKEQEKASLKRAMLLGRKSFKALRKLRIPVYAEVTPIDEEAIKLAEDLRRQAEIQEIERLAAMETESEAAFRNEFLKTSDVDDRQYLLDTRVEAINKKKRLANASSFRKHVHHIIEQPLFTTVIMSIIFFNTGLIIAQTFEYINVYFEFYISECDTALLGIYIFEAIIKLIALRRDYFSDSWNILDFTIVIFSVSDQVLPYILENVASLSGAAIFRVFRIFRIIRALRALRMLRTIKFLGNLQLIVSSFFSSMQSIGSIACLMFLFLYMFAVIGRGLFALLDPVNFGNLGRSSLTLFGLLTLDNWGDIYHKSKKDPVLLAFLLVNIAVEYVCFMSLLVAVLVDSFQIAMEKVKLSKVQEATKDILEQERELQAELRREAQEAQKEHEEEIKKSGTDYTEEHDIRGFYSNLDPKIAKKDIELLDRHFKLLPAIDFQAYLFRENLKLYNHIFRVCTTDEMIDAI